MNLYKNILAETDLIPFRWCSPSLLKKDLHHKNLVFKVVVPNFAEQLL